MRASRADRERISSTRGGSTTRIAAESRRTAAVEGERERPAADANPRAAPPVLQALEAQTFGAARPARGDDVVPELESRPVDSGGNESAVSTAFGRRRRDPQPRGESKAEPRERLPRELAPRRSGRSGHRERS